MAWREVPDTMISRIDIRDVKPYLPPSPPQRLADDEMVPWALPKGETLAPLNAEEDKTYAEVRVNGEVVATLTNNGYMTTSNAMGHKLMALLAPEDSTTRGPALAQQRAEKIAKALGGEIVTAETAMTQARWNARPPAPDAGSPAARLAEAARHRPTLDPALLAVLTLQNQERLS